MKRNREEFIPMMESSYIPNEKKVRPCVSGLICGFLILFWTGSVLISASFGEVPSGTINIISGSSDTYDRKYYFKIPWDNARRVNVPLRGNEIVFPTFVAQNDEEIAVYKNCELTYDISDIDKFVKAVGGDASRFALDLIKTISDYVERNISTFSSFKNVLSLDDIDPLAQMDYLSSTAFNCTLICPPTGILTEFMPDLNATDDFIDASGDSV